MRSAALILALATAPLLPALARAQECLDPVVGAATAPGDLSGYRTLFQQGGVTFYSRIDEASPDSARLVLRNANRVPVEVAFSVQLVGGAGPEGGVDAGRRCARIEPGRYLAGVGGVTTFGSALGPLTDVRVRNLSLSLLGPPPTSRAETPPVSEPAPTVAAAPAGDAERDPGFRCDAGEGSVADRRACAARYEAASARAATVRGTFAGVSRDCLLRYATLHSGAAAAGGVPPTPSCFDPDRARWDRTALARACPGRSWTARNAGVVDCAVLAGFEQAPEPVASAEPAEPLPELPVTTTAEPAAGPAPEPRPVPALEIPVEAVQEPILSPRRWMEWLSLAMRVAAAVVLVAAGIGLALPILVALYAVLVLTPAALLTRLLRRAAPTARNRAM